MRRNLEVTPPLIVCTFVGITSPVISVQFLNCEFNQLAT